MGGRGAELLKVRIFCFSIECGFDRLRFSGLALEWAYLGRKLEMETELKKNEKSEKCQM